jgi:FkbM family methyltransferase
MKVPKILVYCGIHECATFAPLAARFDICYGIEADPRLAAKARERFASNRNVHIVHAAACEQSGSVTFNLHDNPAASSMGRMGDGYRKSTGNDIRPVESVQVPAINLYDFLRSREVECIDLYQSDIQGMDFTVLNTLRPLIEARGIRMIRCETERDDHAFQSYEGLPSNRQSLFRALLEKDYRISTEQKVKPNWAHQDITWKLRPGHLLRWHMRRWGLIQGDGTSP